MYQIRYGRHWQHIIWCEPYNFLQSALVRAQDLAESYFLKFDWVQVWNIAENRMVMSPATLKA